MVSCEGGPPLCFWVATFPIAPLLLKWTSSSGGPDQPELKASVLQPDLVQALVLLLEDSAECRSDALSVLCDMLSGNSNAQRIFLDKGGLPVLVRMISTLADLDSDILVDAVLLARHCSLEGEYFCCFFLFCSCLKNW